MDYLRATQSEMRDIAEVCRARGLELNYSMEDSDDLDGGIEYHIYDNFDEVESILWASAVIDGENALTPVITGVYADSP